MDLTVEERRRRVLALEHGKEADVYLRQQLKQLIKPGGDDVTVFNGNEQKLRKRANAGDSDAEIELRSGVELLMRMLKHGMPKTSKSQRIILDAIKSKMWIETGKGDVRVRAGIARLDTEREKLTTEPHALASAER